MPMEEPGLLELNIAVGVGQLPVHRKRRKRRTQFGLFRFARKITAVAALGLQV